MTEIDQTPDALLIEEILAALGKDRLLSDKQLEALRPKLASGKMKAEDWHVMIDLAVDAEAKNG
ncbi:MAG: hypothetical protein AAB262_09325 [Elusimicrobiota bacterium]